MKSIMIAAPASGCGKTTVSLGIIRALVQDGVNVSAFKAGPDYIDRAFLQEAAGKPAGNLDIHIQGEKGLHYALSQSKSDHCIIEGMMGYFDGISNTYQNSCYHISNLLGIDTVLIYTPRGEMFSAIPKIKGMADFEKSNIKAVIFNNVNEKYYQLLKNSLEQYTDLQVLGYMPKLENVILQSRHLGLVQSDEIPDLQERIDRIAETVRRYIDLENLCKLMKEIKTSAYVNEFLIPRKKIRVAIARDQAFSFYYTENLRLLEDSCQVIYFSPLQDQQPPSCDMLYLGGGYPEVFKDQLSLNRNMLKAIREFGESGGFIYAECGGFMYLTEYIEDKKMVGLFKGKCQLTDKLQNFGYVELELKQDCFLGQKGDRLRGHEFHKSLAAVNGKTLFTVSKTMGKEKWEGGYSYKNVIAGFPHIGFVGNIKMLENMLETAERYNA